MDSFDTEHFDISTEHHYFNRYIFLYFEFNVSSLGRPLSEYNSLVNLISCLVKQGSKKHIKIPFDI